MKRKQLAQKALTPMSAFAAMIMLGVPGAKAQTVFDATFPSSWDGTSTTVTDQSGSSNTGFQSGTATYSTTTVPPDAAAGTGSMVLSGAGGIKITPTSLLNNTAVAGAGGFTYNVDFMWNGSATPTIQKLIDYAGTESLQLVSPVANTSATLQMVFTGDKPATGNAPSTVASSFTIAANTWYDVTMTFDTTGNSLVGGDISGVESLYVNGSLVGTASATKSGYGDSLGRPIGIGEFGYGHTTSILGLDGAISSASIDLGVVAPAPEPSTTALMGVFGGLAAAWKLRRRKK